MGNIVSYLKTYMFNRRRHKTIDSHSRQDHPEKLPSHQLPTANNTERQSKLSPSSAAATTIETERTTTLIEGAMLVKTNPAETIIAKPTTEMEQATNVEPEEVTTTIVKTTNKCSDFYVACRTNNIDEVKRLLQTISLEDIDRLEPNGSTALHSACHSGHHEIVKLLLEAGADRAIHNVYNCLPFDEAANDEIKTLFLRIPNTNRFVSNTGAIEWELIHDDVRETAAEERHLIKSIYDNTSGLTPIKKMFERIEMNYINQGLAHFDGIDKIKRFFRRATKEQDPRWIIKAYTAETEFYKVLNVDIACGTTQHQNERRYIIALLSYHPILNKYTFIGTSYRVMKINYNDLQKYQKNSLLMTKSFLSSSIDERITAWILCEQEISLVENPHRQRVKMDGTLIKSWIMCKYLIKHPRSALHIEEISQYTNEGEILIMPYTVFKINKIEKVKPSYLIDEQSITVIELEECDNEIN